MEMRIATVAALPRNDNISVQSIVCHCEASAHTGAPIEGLTFNGGRKNNVIRRTAALMGLQLT